MILQDVWDLELDFSTRKPILIEPVEEPITTDAGLLLFGQLDRELDFTSGFAAQLQDSRQDPDHSFLQMVRSRIYGILAGYEDQNDHDALRSDPVFKLLSDRLPDDDDLASQPTLSRFENSITPRSLLQLEAWFINRFVESFDEPPGEITLDIDVFDDPTHGQQQLTLFHGFYKQYQYLVRVITCAENDQVVLPVLLYGTAHAAMGAHVDIARVVRALRVKFPDVRIKVRADSGYAVPMFYETHESLRIDYTIGIGMNAVLKRLSADLLQQAVEQYGHTGQPQRLFTGFFYQAGTWPEPRWVVVKCEANAQGTNRRAVVTNRPGARVVPQGAYEEYAERGESENRNKELKCELCADRLSDHRYMANCFRMFLHCAAANLLVHMRRQIAAPPVEPATQVLLDMQREPTSSVEEEIPRELASEVLVDPGQNNSARVSHEVPAEASGGRQRRQQFNRRRQADPLGEGHACTWRLMLIKVAARIQVTARRVRVLLSGCWPFLPFFRDVGRALVGDS